MRKLFLIILVLLLTGCTTIDEEQLKQEIKEEILEEIELDASMLNEHLIEVSSSISEWTVAIEVTQGETTTIGSGIIYSNDGNEYFILTNEHVIRYADSIEVFVPSQDLYITASVEKTDADLDLAILSISSLTELSCHEITAVEYQIGEMVPLRIEYTITDDTSIVYSTDTCSQQYGCYESFATPEDQYFTIYFEYGELLYQSITFAETDKQVVYNETIQRDVCMDVGGCWYEESVYDIVEDDLGTVLYSFSQGVWVQYGSTAPFKVTATLDQVTLQYQQIGTQTDSICNQASCLIDYPVHLESTARESYHLGYYQDRIEQGERIIQSVTISADAFISSQDQNVCTMVEGCTVDTTYYIILDSDGNEIQNEYNEWRGGLPVLFAYGELVPEYNQFTATFNIQNMEYQKQRVSIYEFINRIDQAIALDDNLYLIESESWIQGDENFILTFNEETNRYAVKFTNMSAVLEITEVDDGFIAINDLETAIVKFTYNEELSSENYYYFEVVNLTEGLEINGVNDLIVDYDGSIYFKGVDNFIQDITGLINEFGEIQIDTEYTEHEVVRVRPIN